MKVLFAAGGTAGHINPAITIAKRVMKENKNAQILFIGTKRGIEASLVEREGFKIEFIEAEGFLRSLSPKNIQVAVKAMIGLTQTARIIKSFKPDVAVGTGGYVSGPAILCAKLFGIPCLIHEQNVFPGLTVRMLARFVDKVAISFEDTYKYLKKTDNIVLTGNPIRSSLVEGNYDKARSELSIDGRPFILIFGGSLGAMHLNSMVLEFLKLYKGKTQILWGTGERDFERINKELGSLKISGLTVVPYIYNMDTAMAAADLVISRSGAITLSEICILAKPAILIPSPNVTHNHQEYNAKALSGKGGAVLITEKELTPTRLLKEVEGLIESKGQLSVMSQSLKELAIINADEKIYKIIHNLLKNRP